MCVCKPAYGVRRVTVTRRHAASVSRSDRTFPRFRGRMSTGTDTVSILLNTSHFLPRWTLRSTVPTTMHRTVLRRCVRPGIHHARRSYHASVLPSLLSTSSPEFVAKSQAMDELVADFEGKVAAARLGGGTKAAERMRSKGKKLPRERYEPSS